MSIEITSAQRMNITENLLALGIEASEVNIGTVASLAGSYKLSLADAAKHFASVEPARIATSGAGGLSEKGLADLVDRWSNEDHNKVTESRRELIPEEMLTVPTSYANAEIAEGRTVVSFLTPEESLAVINNRLNTPDPDTAGIWKLELEELFERIGKANAAKGFHERGEELLARLTEADIYLEKADEDKVLQELNEYIGNRLMLVVSELVEAQDELRNGHRFDETYYPGKGSALGVGADGQLGTPRKPEGFISEIADAIIRLGDLAEELQVVKQVVDMIEEKLAYNASRPHRHGKRF